MRKIVVSDIHGSVDSVQQLFNAMQFHQITDVICLGDFLYHGPRNPLPETYDPKTCVHLLNTLEQHITAVRGNCDAEVDQMVLDFSLSETYKTIKLDQKVCLLTHGHVYHPEKLPENVEAQCILFGHTHIPLAKKTNGIYTLNPGSITLPKQDHPRTYAILEDHEFTVYTLDHQIYKQISF